MVHDLHISWPLCEQEASVVQAACALLLPCIVSKQSLLDWACSLGRHGSASASTSHSDRKLPFAPHHHLDSHRHRRPASLPLHLQALPLRNSLIQPVLPGRMPHCRMKADKERALDLREVRHLHDAIEDLCPHGLQQSARLCWLAASLSCCTASWLRCPPQTPPAKMDIDSVPGFVSDCKIMIYEESRAGACSAESALPNTVCCSVL